MSEIITGCSYTYGSALEQDCEEEPKWRLWVLFSLSPVEPVNLISCDHHLADVARVARGLTDGVPPIYGAALVTVEELGR